MSSLLLTAAIAFLLSATAQGSVFERPPEDNPAITWSGAFPYQRNILMNFDTVSPVAGAPGPIPGADYEGHDDPELWWSDFMELEGDVVWDPSVGAIGIFGGGSGAIRFHFDNWDRPWIKHLYEEMIFEVVGARANIAQEIVLPSGFEVTDTWEDVEALGNGRYAAYIWAEIFPNPPWEEKYITLSVGDTGSVYIDSLHIATECVPEPATLAVWSLLACVGVGLVMWRRHS